MPRATTPKPPATSPRDERVPFPRACMMLRLSRDQVMHRLAIGELQGGKELSRWFVTRASIERMLAEGRNTSLRPRPNDRADDRERPRRPAA
ncbi:hypothetical protein J421_0044 [Gemmatirosa kalamazoonensis]|uniref:Helix-turn-helix domain-containing protein n=1 Tax=Gemmatirosa kalamazoonensis TaxID=861299 RepID=W0RB67_9BACT|nr:hypothetical protein [Gemmatirosa kalamazoonensis]AHG87560.1 hypothetical protein J421_0022 [Gemmatirosa kalamazoonensis]AHG87581.1 hypothetical protein J421_0044 [Gemmatirosa kalamazoonensis]